MAVVTINIPDAQLGRVIDGFCAAYGWTAADGNKAAYAKAKLIEHIRSTVVGQERAAAQQQALNNVQVQDVTLT